MATEIQEFSAIDNEFFVVASGSPAGTAGDPIGITSDTSVGTVFTLLPGFQRRTIVVSDNDRDGTTDLFDDDSFTQEIIDGGGLTQIGPNQPNLIVESESAFRFQEIDGAGNPRGPEFVLFTFSQNTDSRDIWGLGWDGTLQENALYQYLGSRGGSSDGTSDYDLFPVCFSAETPIRTPSGRRAAGTINVGDRIWTQEDPCARVRWVGRADCIGRGTFAPVVFAPGALGNRTEVRLSQQHRVLVDWACHELLFGEAESLVPARHLVGMPGITLQPCDRITYCHIAVEGHAITSATGLRCETFDLAAASAGLLSPEAEAEVRALFPDLDVRLPHLARRTLKRWEAEVLVQEVARQSG